MFKAKVDVAIVKRAVYQSRMTTKPKNKKPKGKAGLKPADTTPDHAYTIQELSDDKEGSDPEHVFTTIMV